MTRAIDQLMSVMEESFDPHFQEAWTRAQVEGSLALPTAFMALIDEHGEPCDGDTTAAGFILARRAADEVELLLIAVRPRFRGRGLSNILLDTLSDIARRHKARQVFLEVRADNPARHVYRKAGFEQIGQRKDYYRTRTGTTIDAITYGKQL